MPRPPLLGDDKGRFRIQIIGNSGAGKSTLSATLSTLLNIPVIPLDEINWRPDWKEAPREEFRAQVREAMDENGARGWIIDGNYFTKLGDEFVTSQATDVVWLDPPLILYFPRLLFRSIGRILGLVKPCSLGCPETIQECFFSKDSILLWCLSHHSIVRERGRRLMRLYGADGGKMRRIGGWGGQLTTWIQDVREMARVK
ncbi:hypothetical protein M378DRAFT_130202 [Amanita muscaria Koide BX008]|uniref:Adenylate kinase n=1 Tax=Amanita muscaria (strain Koide BX008) TaxID=946122 RepID=A0A0C2T3B8_AMAMK|nr:hypothetical protein M378DRAFT_130202 [Amanita muscaria Koide BX008]